MRFVLAWLATLAFAGAAIAADEDKDLDLIPHGEKPASPNEATAPSSDGSRRAYIENALAFASRRGDLLVPSPPPLPPRWQERLFADARIEWPIASSAFVTYSGRLELRDDEGLGFPNRGNVAHSLRELYASVEPSPRQYVDAGRINIKNGVALGFNPTDFFKARAVIDPLTADPRALREDRLGTLAVRGQTLGERGSLSVAYSPRVTDASALGTNPDRGFSPLFGRTNATDRWLMKASLRLPEGLNPEALLYREKGVTKFGANIAESIGQSSVVYLEWSGARRLGIIDEALAFGREQGLLPASAPDVIGQRGDKRFRSQVTFGASYTTENKITFNLEYHYNQAAFSGSDWDRWFETGARRPASSPFTRELWLVRGYASELQEPLQRHAVFLRADWVDFLLPKLELTAFTLVDMRDGSSIMQLEATYARTDLWSFGILAGGTIGGRRSNFGSLPSAANILFGATRYF